jgi:ABC-type multidrug transport system permease subunit
LTYLAELGRAGALVAATARRDFLVARSYRTALIVESGTALIGVLVYYYISRALDGGRIANLDGAASYFEFALVGVVFASVVQAATVTLALRLREAQLTGSLEAVLAQPVRSGELAVALACYPFAFATLRALAYIVVAALLLDADFSEASWLGATLVMAGAALTMSAIGMLFAAAVILVKRAESITGLVMFGLSFLAGAFFPVETLPAWLEAVSTVVPTRVALDGLRSALFEGSDWVGAAALLAAIGIAALPLGILAFSAAIASGRRRATLTEY